MIENKQDSKQIIAGIHYSIDRYIKNYKTWIKPHGENGLFGEIACKPTATKVVDDVIQIRLQLAEHYCMIPYEEARRCYERIELLDELSQNYLERKRLEYIVYGRKKK